MLLDLTKENELLRERNDELEAQLQDRMLAISNAGTLAEAALQLNSVFESAQAACDQYIYNMQLRCQKLEEDTKSRCERMLNGTEYLMEVYEKEDAE